MTWRQVAILLLAGLTLGWWWTTPAETATPWPTTLWFESVDHEIVCPAERCVNGYLQEIWPAATVGVGNPVWKLTRSKWEVTPTGTTPPYKMTIVWPHHSYLPKNVPLALTLRAYGASVRDVSARSNPTPETVILLPPLAPTGPVVRTN